MPELPEEGHIVASLRPDDICQVSPFFNFSLSINVDNVDRIYVGLFCILVPSKVGKLVSVDDEDQARVSFEVNPDLTSQSESSSTVITLPLDRLCKVAMT